MRLRRASEREAGFTLTELAIAIACVAVLSTIVVTMRGFIVDAQTKSTFAKVVNIQSAAHNWSKRKRGGQGYAGGNRYTQADERLSIAALITEGLLEDEDPGAGFGVWTDWRVALPPITIGPTGGVTPGVGQTQFWLRICTPTPETADDFENMSRKWETLSRRRYTGGGCPCNNCVFEYIVE